MDKALDTAGEITAIMVVFATLLELLPVVAAGLAILWWGMKIYLTRLEIKGQHRKDEREADATE